MPAAGGLRYRERVGVDQMTVGTDHPFAWDHPGGAANWIRGADFLAPADREKILWRNAARLYDLDADELLAGGAA